MSRSHEVASGPQHFLRNKRQEWEEYRSEVTAFELRKNLPVL
nr:glutamine synthetase [Streptomyces sp. CRN 30]